MDLPVRRARRRRARTSVLNGRARVRARPRTSRRPRWCPAPAATWSTTVANGPSRVSANALTSEPGSPKSRANTSGKTTRSRPAGRQLGQRRPGSVPGRGRRRAGSGTPAAGRSRLPACHPQARDGRIHPCRSFAAVILTGGAAARLDGVDKASIEYAGRSLLARAVDAVADATEVVVVGATGPDAGTGHGSPARTRRPGARPPGSWPGATRSAPPVDLLVVLAVDMPLVSAGTVAAAAARRRGPGRRLPGPTPTGRRQLAGVLRRDTTRRRPPTRPRRPRSPPAPPARRPRPGERAGRGARPATSTPGPTCGT